MMPIQDLLHRIRWDEEFAKGEFVIGYLDRVAGQVVKVPIESVYFSQDDPFRFQLVDEEGEIHAIPLHRIKIVYRNGVLIWHREH